eukprot:g2435.t1
MEDIGEQRKSVGAETTGWQTVIKGKNGKLQHVPADGVHVQGTSPKNQSKKRKKQFPRKSKVPLGAWWKGLGESEHYVRTSGTTTCTTRSPDSKRPKTDNSGDVKPRTGQHRRVKSATVKRRSKKRTFERKKGVSRVRTKATKSPTSSPIPKRAKKKERVTAVAGEKRKSDKTGSRDKTQQNLSETFEAVVETGKTERKIDAKDSIENKATTTSSSMRGTKIESNQRVSESRPLKQQPRSSSGKRSSKLKKKKKNNSKRFSKKRGFSERVNRSSTVSPLKKKNRKQDRGIPSSVKDDDVGISNDTPPVLDEVDEGKSGNTKKKASGSTKVRHLEYYGVYIEESQDIGKSRMCEAYAFLVTKLKIAARCKNFVDTYKGQPLYTYAEASSYFHSEGADFKYVGAVQNPNNAVTPIEFRHIHLKDFDIIAFGSYRARPGKNNRFDDNQTFDNFRVLSGNYYAANGDDLVKWKVIDMCRLYPVHRSGDMSGEEYWEWIQCAGLADLIETDIADILTRLLDTRKDKDMALKMPCWGVTVRDFLKTTGLEEKFSSQIEFSFLPHPSPKNKQIQRFGLTDENNEKVKIVHNVRWRKFFGELRGAMGIENLTWNYALLKRSNLLHLPLRVDLVQKIRSYFDDSVDTRRLDGNEFESKDRVVKFLNAVMDLKETDEDESKRLDQKQFDNCRDKVFREFGKCFEKLIKNLSGIIGKEIKLSVEEEDMLLKAHGYSTLLDSEKWSQIVECIRLVSFGNVSIIRDLNKEDLLNIFTAHRFSK